jgi:hypothetical protein
MNSARDYACSVWRSPVPSVEVLEGALVSYAEEVTAGLRKEKQELSDSLQELIGKWEQKAEKENNSMESLNIGFAGGLWEAQDQLSTLLSTHS